MSVLIMTQLGERPPRSPGSLIVPARDAGAEFAAHLARYEAIFELAPMGIGVVDLDGRAVLTNEALRRMLGYTAEEFATLHWEAFTHPEDIERNRELLAEMAAGERDRFEMDKRFFHKDGSIIWGHLTVSLLKDESGGPPLHIGLLENITQRKALEEQLTAAEATYRLLVEEAPAVVYVAGLGKLGPFSYVSPQIEAMLGYTAEEWIADPQLWSSLIEPGDLEATLAAGRAALACGSTDAVVTHYRMTRRDGTLIWVRDEFQIVEAEEDACDSGAGSAPGGRPARRIRGVMLDATREKELEERLEQQAFHDSLTQLANRELFGDRIEHCMRRLRRTPGRHDAVVFIDLDDFKTINDSLGHAAGDELLCSVAERISGCLRPDDSAGRLGGDEFALLIEDVRHPSDVLLVAQRVQEAVQRPHELSGKTVVTSASLGIAYLRDADDTDTVLRNADLAMYRAKELGKGRVATYEPVLHTAAVRRLDIRSTLQGALERDELSMHVQPIVDLATTVPIGAEALLRWRHPHFGRIPPNDFIPIAEETGAIGRIGEWAIRRSCAWLATQRRAGGADLYVSVNISPVQLQGLGLVGTVADALAFNDLPPSSLVLEITERGFMSEHSWAELRELKELGVRIAIDDFGTGYASLAYLSELSVDMLKIDRLFVGRLGSNERSLAVPRAITQLARSLGLDVVAEGIETTEQCQALRAFGCTAGQGHLFAAPRPAAALLSVR